MANRRAWVKTHWLTARSAARLGLLLGGATLASCGGEAEKSESSLGSAKQEQVVVSDTEQTLTTTIRLPAGVSLGQAVVSAAEALSLGDRANIGGQATAGTDLVLGNDAQSGSLSAGGQLTLRDRSTVNGDVNATGAVQQGSGSTVTGTVNAPAPVEFVDHSWTVTAPTASGGDVNLEPDTSSALGAGNYGQVAVKSRASLLLRSGVYIFSRLQLEPQAELSIDDRDGPVQIYVTSGFTFRGATASATFGAPQLLISYLGTDPAFVEAPFDGVLAAPNAELRVQAARPRGHRARFYGRNVTLEPDMLVRAAAFDWPGIIGSGGPGITVTPGGPGGSGEPEPGGPFTNPGIPPGTPVHEMPASSPGDVTVFINGDGSGSPTATGSSPTPVGFTLPADYPVEGGVIGNGTVTFTFTPPGGDPVACTYQGQSPTAEPTTSLDLNLGRLLRFVSCTDGLPHDAPRQGVDFELGVNPAPGYPVTITSPMLEEDTCDDRMELISAADTETLRTSFNWNAQRKVPVTDANGDPTLFYSWIYIRNQQEALALKQLYIHVLERPLFTSELDQFAGRCGSFSNPGDGGGAFVSALIPGGTYNRLIDALTSDDVSGDKVIFDAVILREVPAEARTPEGSVNLTLLANSGFRYLGYEPNPFRPFNEFELDSGAAKALTDSLEWVAQAARDVGEFVTNTLGELDQLFRGEVSITLHMTGVSRDPEFGSNGAVMVRGWGPDRNTPLAAIGAEVTLLQKLFDSPIPTTAQGRTDTVGQVTIDATEDAEGRGNGICLELRTPGVMVTDFLIAKHVCDLRQWDPTTGDTQVFRMRNFSRGQPPVELRIGNTEVVGMYQADDTYRWSRSVLDFDPKRARILTGYWANTFAPEEDGQKGLFAPCLNYRNSVSDTALLAGATAGFLAQLIVPIPILPILTGTFTAVLFNSDIVMSTESSLRRNRLVMSHEYGHYLFCSLLQEENGASVDHVIWSTIAAGDALDVPVRYTNEAMADYFASQVGGGANYGWLTREVRGDYCVPPAAPELACWEHNQAGSPADPDDPAGIGRIATLVMDGFDGHGAARGAEVPTDGDVWTFSDPTNRASPLVYSETGFMNLDSHLERVALPASGIRSFTSTLARGLGVFGTGDTINDPKVYGALDDVMEASELSWCERCRVFALHAPSAGLGETPAVHELFEACVNDPLVAGAVGPPVDAAGNPIADLRFDAATCTECPPGTTSDADGVCQVCANIVQGNTCTTCTADAVLDGATMELRDQGFQADGTSEGDTCPEVFVVQVDNAAALIARGAVNVGARVDASPFDQPNCERPYELGVSIDGMQGPVLSSTGVFSDCPPDSQICLPFCDNLPSRVLAPAELTSGVLQLTTPVNANTTLVVSPSMPVAPPR